MSEYWRVEAGPLEGFRWDGSAEVPDWVRAEEGAEVAEGAHIRFVSGVDRLTALPGEHIVRVRHGVVYVRSDAELAADPDLEEREASGA